MQTGRDDTREAFLAAGVRLYASLSRRLLRGFSAGTVASEAGFRRQTFYRYWETQADYVRDLIAHVLTDHAPAADGMAVLPSRRETDVDWSELARAIARYDYSRTAVDPRVAMRLGLSSMQATEVEGLREHAQAFHDRVMDRLGSAFHEVLSERGRVPRGRLTARDLARVQQALLAGLIVWEMGAKDEPSSGELYEEVFGPMLEALTEPAGRAEGDG